MASAGQRAPEQHQAEPEPQVVIVVGGTDRAARTYCVQAPDRVLRMFGLLNATRDELDLATLPSEGRSRVHRLLEAVSAELARSVSPPLASELRSLVPQADAAPSAAELRIEYAGLLGWASGLVVAMLSQLDAVRDKPSGHPVSSPLFRYDGRSGRWPSGATAGDDEGPARVG